MAKTCIRVEACNIGSSERHNLRSKELDYIRPELTHRNEQWVECSIAEVHRDITEKYKEATGQGLQKKATPIREGVIVISEEPITNLFPEMENAQENIEELQTMGIQNKDIRQLLIGKEIYYTGNLYDKDKRKSYQVKNVKIDISKSQNGITTIWLNNIHFKNFLKELWNTLQKTLDNGNWLHR